MPEAEHTRRLLHLLYHRSDILGQNLSKMSEKYKDETGLDTEKHIAPFSLTEWKNSSARWQIQSPDSPE